VGSLRLLRLVKELSSVSTDMRVRGTAQYSVATPAAPAAPPTPLPTHTAANTNPTMPRCTLQIIASSIFTSLPALGNVLVLALVFCTCFSLVGMELWAGVMAGVCGYTDTGTGERVLLPGMPCALPCAAFDADGNARCTPTYGDACPATLPVPVTVVPANASAGTDAVMTVATLPLACMRGANPDAGMTHFDNYGNAVRARWLGLGQELSRGACVAWGHAVGLYLGLPCHPSRATTLPCSC